MDILINIYMNFDIFRIQLKNYYNYFLFKFMYLFNFPKQKKKIIHNLLIIIPPKIIQNSFPI